jgi:hypothetical protein
MNYPPQVRGNVLLVRWIFHSTPDVACRKCQLPLHINLFPLLYFPPGSSLTRPRQEVETHASRVWLPLVVPPPDAPNPRPFDPPTSSKHAPFLGDQCRARRRRAPRSATAWSSNDSFYLIPIHISSKVGILLSQRVIFHLWLLSGCDSCYFRKCYGWCRTHGRLFGWVSILERVLLLCLLIYIHSRTCPCGVKLMVFGH